MPGYNPPMAASNASALTPPQSNNLQRMINALSGQTPPLLGPHSLEQPSGLDQLRGNIPANMLNTPMDQMRMQRAPAQSPPQLQPLPGQMR